MRSKLSPSNWITDFNELKVDSNSGSAVQSNTQAETNFTTLSLNHIESPKQKENTPSRTKSLNLKFDLTQIKQSSKQIEENMIKQEQKMDQNLLQIFQKLQLENQQNIKEQVDKEMRVINILLKNVDFKFEDFEILNELGRGASGKVYRIRHKGDGKIYAMKEILIIDNNDVRDKLILEIKTLFACQSPYIVSYYGAFYTEGKLHLILEYMDRGTLESILKKAGGKVSEVILKYTTYQILKGLKYLHKDLHVIHRDIKPGNILVNSKGEIKISDLGICSQLNFTLDERKTFVGTTIYMSPERLTGESYTIKTDIWSLGFLMYEFSEGVNPLGEKQSENFFEVLEKVMNFSIPKLNNVQSKEYIEFLELCTKRDPKERADILKLLELPFINSFKGKTAKLQPIFVNWLKLTTD